MFNALRKDSLRYRQLGGWYAHPGFWLIAVYRYGMWVSCLPGLIRWPFWIIYRVARLPYRLFNLDLWAGKTGAKIGAGFCLIHPTNVVIGRGVEIGENCKIFHEVTLGTGHIEGTPKIGSNTDIFVGARILGGVRIGDNSMISANCVITKDVPNDSVVVSAPNRIVPRSLSPRARSMDVPSGD